MKCKNKIYYDSYLINFSSSTGYPTIFVNGKNRLLHRYVWEKFNGKIPKDKHVHHKDENKLNYDISNLELIDVSEHHKNHAIKNKLGLSNKGKHKTYVSGFCGMARVVIATKDDEKLYFRSASEASRNLNIKIGMITRVARGERKSTKGWRFEYAS